VQPHRRKQSTVICSQICSRLRTILVSRSLTKLGGQQLDRCKAKKKGALGNYPPAPMVAGVRFELTTYGL
jgi:hypothetical protein